MKIPQNNIISTSPNVADYYKKEKWYLLQIIAKITS